MTRILVVEGDAREGARLNASLQGHAGWEITRAGSLLAAIRAAGDTCFDGAVLDTDLPDGSGMDILDFLRIGSPGIRILLVAEKGSESVALHALSHGAGDFIVKDGHLEAELPRRMDALLDLPHPMGALVETLSPVAAYDLSAPLPPRERKLVEGALAAALEVIVGGNVLAAGVWNVRGVPLATNAPADIDVDGIGFAMATLHGQVGALWTYGALRPTGYRFVIDVEGGLLAITAIPGTYLIGVLFEPGVPPRRVMDTLDQAGLRVLAALQGGASGGDLPT